MSVILASVLLLLCLTWMGGAYPSVHANGMNSAVVFDYSSKVTYVGRQSQGTESFLNIRFGQDTRGANRFAPPLPFHYPDGTVVNATLKGAACPQARIPVPGLDLFSNVTDISEDCLNLRIDRPANMKQNAKLPVLLWIYGGGDSIGQIYDELYDPRGLVLGSATKGTPVIYAAMNYRLGFFGWSAFEPNSDLARPNAGLLDQRLAMEWIRKNIAAFGGDPDNVTIFGQSDGGVAVGLHIIAYGGGKPAPFRRAIAQSGAATADPGINSRKVHNATRQLTARLNCTSDDPNTTIRCLRRLPLDVILPIALEYDNENSGFAGFDVFVPTVDGAIIPEAPSALLKAGRFSRDIDAIFGWCENDGTLFTASPENFRDSSFLGPYISSQFGAFTPELVQATLEQYPADDPLFLAAHKAYPGIPINWFRAAQIIRDSQDSCPALLQVQSLANYSCQKTVTHLYALNSTLYAPLLEASGVPFEGVIHTSDIPYVFNEASGFSNVSTEEIARSNRISGSWAEFASSGRVTVEIQGNSIENWPLAISTGSQGKDVGVAIRVIGGPKPRVVRASSGLARGHDFEELGRRCAFWNSAELLAAVQV